MSEQPESRASASNPGSGRRPRPLTATAPNPAVNNSSTPNQIIPTQLPNGVVTVADSSQAAVIRGFERTEQFPAFVSSTQTNPNPSQTPDDLPRGRRRSRNVTEHDLRILQGTPARRVFDYADLTRALRAPPQPARFPPHRTEQVGHLYSEQNTQGNHERRGSFIVEASPLNWNPIHLQPGTDRPGGGTIPQVPTPERTLSPYNPAWDHQSRFPFPDQQGSRGPPGPTSG